MCCCLCVFAPVLLIHTRRAISHLVLSRYDDKLVNVFPHLPRGKGNAEIVDLVVVRQLKLDLCANIETGREPAYGLVVEAEDRRAGRDHVQATRFSARVLHRERQHEQQSRTHVFEHDLFGSCIPGHVI